MGAMHRQLSTQLDFGLKQQEQALAQLTAMHQQLALQQQQISGLNDRLTAEQEKTLRLDKALQETNSGCNTLLARVAALEKQLEAVAPMQQQLAKLEQQRPASYAAAVTGPAPTTSATPSEYQNSFRMPVCKHVKLGATYSDLAEQVVATVGDLLKEGDAPLKISHLENARIVVPKARPGPAGSAPAPAPAPFVVFKVSEGEAQLISKHRTQLAGTGVTICDWLTPEENQRRRALMPLFKTARADKLRTYWRRAQLFVAGVEVHPPSAAAAAPAAA
jgi:hypothetical protein